MVCSTNSFHKLFVCFLRFGGWDIGEWCLTHFETEIQVKVGVELGNYDWISTPEISWFLRSDCGRNFTIPLVRGRILSPLAKIFGFSTSANNCLQLDPLDSIITIWGEIVNKSSGSSHFLTLLQYTELFMMDFILFIICLTEL